MNLRVGICLAALSCSFAIVVADEPTASPESIRALIDRLGAPDYSQRQLADAELRHLGMVAFDYLHEAVSHQDLEVRMRARAILRSLKQQHLFADLDPALRRLLRNYSSLPTAERQQRVLQLIPLLPQQGADAVARLARFEEEESIAQLGAIGLLSSQMPPDQERQRAIAEQVKANLADSSTVAARWLKVWAKSISDPAATLDEWEQLFDQLRDEPELTDVNLFQVRDLTLRLAHLDAVVRAGQLESAQDEVHRLMKEMQTNSMQEMRWIRWLIDRKLWSVLEEHRLQAEDRLSSNPQLHYLFAESLARQDRNDEAEQMAQEAFEDNKDGLRLEVAVWLDNERGRFDWAEREYRAVISERPDEIYQQWLAHYQLADMLHDIQRDDQAADVLESWIEYADESEDLRKNLELSPRGLKDSRARIHLYRALHAQRQNDSTTELQELTTGFQEHSEEIDLLIACYRCTDAPPEWRNKVVRTIESVTRRYHQEIQTQRQQLERQPNLLSDENYDSLAQTMNEYAWVVSNTEGDLQQALEYSKLSNQYVPGSHAYLDTLGRSYYAVGDLEQAIAHQRMASERAPFEEQIRRQLDQFVDARDRAMHQPRRVTNP